MANSQATQQAEAPADATVNSDGLPGGERLTLAEMSRIMDVASELRKEQALVEQQLNIDEIKVKLRERLLEAAKEGRARPIFGTHDMTTVRHLVGRAESMKVAKGQFEVHMLYGIRSSDQRTLAAEGHSVRCLISYGSQWFPWYMRRLAERPANVWFVVRTAFTR